MTNAQTVFATYTKDLKGQRGVYKPDGDWANRWAQMHSALKPLALSKHTFRLMKFETDGYVFSGEK
eukprot:45289-Eustigmatos_ZCMA.PRE.1